MPPSPEHARLRVVGFKLVDSVSPTCVLSARQEGPEAGSPASSLASALQTDLAKPLPKLSINIKPTGKDAAALKKSKSVADLQHRLPLLIVPMPQLRGEGSEPATPGSRASTSSTPMRIPLGLSRCQTCPAELAELDELSLAATLSLAAGPRPHHVRQTSAGSASIVKDLFDAQANAVTAQTQVHDLAAALRREQGEVQWLRGQLERVLSERDMLLAELKPAGAATTEAVFPMDQGHHVQQ